MHRYLVLFLGVLLGVVQLVPSRVGGVLAPASLLVIGSLAGGAVWLLARVRKRSGAPFGVYTYRPLGALLAVALTATIASVNVRASLVSLALWASALLLFAALADLVRSEGDLLRLLGPVLAASCVTAVWSVYQLVCPPLVAEAWVDPVQGALTRTFAGMDNPNYLAQYLVLFLPPALGLWLALPGQRRLLAVPVGAMGLSLVLTLSRGGWLAIWVAALTYVLLRHRRLAPAFLAVSAAGAVAVVLVGPDSISVRLLSILSGASDSSGQYRLSILAGAGRMLQDVWILGAGLGPEAFAVVYQRYMEPGASAVHAHNTYLQVLGEMGIPGLLGVAWSLVAILRRPLAAARQSPVAGAAAAALVGALFYGLFEHIWYNPKLLFSFWAMAGVAVGLSGGGLGRTSRF